MVSGHVPLVLLMLQRQRLWLNFMLLTPANVPTVRQLRLLLFQNYGGGGSCPLLRLTVIDHCDRLAAG